MSLRRFDGSNFNFWKEQMHGYLIVKGQIDPIENGNAPETYKANEWLKLDRIVRATIRMHLSESVYFTVQSCTTAFDIHRFSIVLRRRGEEGKDLEDKCLNTYISWKCY